MQTAIRVSSDLSTVHVDARARLNRAGEGIMLGSQALARFVIIRENPINSTGRLNKRKNTVRWGARPCLFSSLSRDRQKIFAKKRKKNTHIHTHTYTHTLSHLNWISLSFFLACAIVCVSSIYPRVDEKRLLLRFYLMNCHICIHDDDWPRQYPIRFSIRRSFA